MFCGASDAASVLHLLTPEARASHLAAPLDGLGEGYERPLPQLAIYDQLLGVTAQRPEVRA